MIAYTVLGSSGFIGSHFAAYLRDNGIEPFCPGREEDIAGIDLGNVVYCIGITADFRTRPFDTVEAHVCRLLSVLRECPFRSLTYLSSTRVYRNGPAAEENAIPVIPGDTDQLYNISKLMGESICHASPGRTFIVRLSNVYGPGMPPDNFLAAVIREAVSTGSVQLRTSLDSEKDYISVRDACELIFRITCRGRYGVYNIAAGRNITNREILDAIGELIPCKVMVEADAERVAYPLIDTGRIREEFGFRPRSLIGDLGDIIRDYQRTGSFAVSRRS